MNRILCVCVCVCVYSLLLFSVSKPCLTLCDPMNCSTPGFPVLHCPQSLLTLVSIEPAMPSNHLILCHPLLSATPFSSCPQSFPASGSSHQVAKVLEFPFQHQVFQLFRTISFRMDRLNLLAVQGTLKSLLQHHSSKAPILWHSTFFMIQLSHPYMTTQKQ